MFTRKEEHLGVRASGDHGIVGPQTASARGSDWPSRDIAAPPVGGVATPLPAAPPVTGSFHFDGDHAVAPDGTRFAKRFKKGVFNFGKTSIRDFVLSHLSAFPGVPPSLLNVMQAVSENEGKLEAINSWDDSFMTFGVFQWTAGQANARGELGALLDRLKRRHADLFDELFGRHGLDVLSGPPASPGTTPVGSFSLAGEVLDSAERKERLRTLEWAYRFWIAGQNDVVRTIQIEHAMDRLHIFYRSPKHAINGRPIADYVSSEAGVALLLDQHVNRPGHVPKTLKQAIERLIGAGTPGDPSGWSDADEQRLVREYIELRGETTMTDSDKRAQIVIEAVLRGTISDRRGSFVA